MYWSIDIDRDGGYGESDRVVRKSSNVYFRVVINVKFEITQGKISASLKGETTTIAIITENLFTGRTSRVRFST